MAGRGGSRKGSKWTVKAKKKKDSFFGICAKNYTPVTTKFNA